MGKNIRITLFGESHGKGVGALITGLPPHIPVNEDAIEKALAERRPQRPIRHRPRRARPLGNPLRHL